MTPLIIYIAGCLLSLFQLGGAVRAVKPSCDCSKYHFNDEETSLLKGYEAETAYLLDKAKEIADNYQDELLASSRREVQLFSPISQADRKLREVTVVTDAGGLKAEGQELFSSIMSYFSEHERQVLESVTVQQSLEQMIAQVPKLTNSLETVREPLIECIESRRSNLDSFKAAGERTRDYGKLMTLARNVDTFLKLSKIMKKDPSLVTKQTTLCQDALQIMPDDLKMFLQSTCKLPVDQAVQLYRKESKFMFQALDDDCEEECEITIE